MRTWSGISTSCCATRRRRRNREGRERGMEVRKVVGSAHLKDEANLYVVKVAQKLRKIEWESIDKTIDRCHFTAYVRIKFKNSLQESTSSTTTTARSSKSSRRWRRLPVWADLWFSYLNNLNKLIWMKVKACDAHVEETVYYVEQAEKGMKVNANCNHCDPYEINSAQVAHLWKKKKEGPFRRY